VRMLDMGVQIETDRQALARAEMNVSNIQCIQFKYVCICTKCIPYMFECMYVYIQNMHMMDTKFAIEKERQI
jgi:hypothetical protein